MLTSRNAHAPPLPSDKRVPIASDCTWLVEMIRSSYATYVNNELEQIILLHSSKTHADIVEENPILFFRASPEMPVSISSCSHRRQLVSLFLAGPMLLVVASLLRTMPSGQTQERGSESVQDARRGPRMKLDVCGPQNDLSFLYKL